MKNLDENENRKNEDGLTPNLQANPFSIPKDYFQTLKKEILFNTQLTKLSESTFSTSSDYQAQLTNDILAKVSEEKLKSSVPEDGFAVPDGYFEKLQNEIFKQTVNQPRIVPLKKTKTSWIFYTAAACLALAVSLFAFFSLNTSTNNTVANEHMNIDILPTEEIINYLAFYSETGDLITLSDQLSENSVNFTDSFSSDEIEAYLENSI